MMRRLPSPAAARFAANMATVGFLLAAVLQLLLAAGLAVSAWLVEGRGRPRP